MKEEKLMDSRKRRKLLIFPVLVIPFLTTAFWALGGGEKTSAANVTGRPSGLNLQLPNPQLKEDKKENKLSYYEQAEKDSLLWKGGFGSDPFFLTKFSDSASNQTFGYVPYPLQTAEYKDSNEQKVYKKIAQLNSHLQGENNYDSYTQQENRGNLLNTIATVNQEDVNRLEEMMVTVKSPVAEDPEVAQLNGLMDRILDIQHPERIKDRLKEKSAQYKNQAFAVNGPQNNVRPSFMRTRALLNDSSKVPKHNAFYGPGNEAPETYAHHIIAATVHEAQTLTSGSTVKLRLLTDIVVDGMLIEKGSFVFGTATLQNERLLIYISSIRKGNNLLPVALSVYDLDGLAGIYIPGSISRDVAKQSAEQSVQGIQMMSLDPSFKTQAAAAGIQAAKGLLSKKIKLIKVTVKAGYKVLLKDDRQQAN